MRWREIHQSGTIGDHGVQPRFTPGGEELGLGNGLQCIGAQIRRSRILFVLIHAHKPLRGRTEDDRRLVAPAMRIAVTQLGVLEQRLFFGQQFDDLGIGFPHGHAGKARHGADEPAVIGNGVINRQLVLEADLIVVHAVCRCGMHKAGTAFGRHMLAEYPRHLTVEEGMIEELTFQRRALDRAEHLAATDFITLQAGCQPDREQG